jgi:hypothetical protein
MLKRSEIRSNDAARNKILDDADAVLQDAVLELAGSMGGAESDLIFAGLNCRLKGRFIDYEPGSDIRKYADAISAGNIGTSGF